MQKKNIDPEIELKDDEEEPSLPELPDEAGMEIDWLPGIASGRNIIAEFARHAPSAPGVYRMTGAGGEVLYVGKAKNLKKRILAYARPTGHVSRIARMVAATSAIEFVSTATETEALLLEANLIKRLRPRFNVLLRDDKSFPYILITAGERPPQICKHRGARNRDGDYFGPFAAVNAVNRTITALERAFLIRSCSDAVFESRTRPCLLFQIKRCSAPCTGEISRADYDELVREAKTFLSGKSRAVKEELAQEMDRAAEALDFERAAALRDRLAALSAVQARQGINPRGVEEADVFAIHQDGGFNCIEVFFFRTGQNWGNRAYFPRADRTLRAGGGPGRLPRPVLRRQAVSAADPAVPPDRGPPAAGRSALDQERAQGRDLGAAARREARPDRPRAGQCARGAGPQARRGGLAAAAAGGAGASFGLAQPPRRIEVYDNSHIQGTNAVGAMIVAGPEGLRKNQYRKFNIRSAELTPGDDFGMMREVLQRRFKRLLNEAPRPGGVPAVQSPEPAAAGAPGLPGAGPCGGAGGRGAARTGAARTCAARSAPQEPAPQEAEPGAEPPPPERDDIAWPDLVLIDGGAGQLNAARETLAALGITDVAMAAIAKGPDRDAGRETFHMPGRAPFKLPPRDPVLYFVERLRDEAHRFAIGSHRQRRSRDIREAGLQEIAGIGPTRKRALLRHFGTLKAIERASVADLREVPGVSDETARRIYDFFHDAAR